MPKQTFINLDKKKKQRIYDAAINEFSRTNYQSCQLSNIIKEAGIARGSFYQYFEDKFDLYEYVFSEIAQLKLSYFGDLNQKIQELNFFDLWEQLYALGAQFGLENPKLIKITQFLMTSKDDIYNRLMSKNLQMAKDYYVMMIEANKEKSLLRESVDSEILADLLIETTTNVATEHLIGATEGNIEEQLEIMKQVIRKRLDIFRKGIETGE